METTERYRTLQQGEMLNWYRVEQVLGRGGFGVIYLATDTNLDHQVAIKEYVPGALAAQTTDGSSVKTTITADDLHRWGLERFIREARNLVKFKHPNIVRVISVFEQNDSAYMVMEFEKGVELRAYLARPDVASEEQLQALILPIAQGLAEVHRRGFVHRDVKPSNILVREDGSPVLLDFGSARETALLGDSAFTALVSVGYAPLEQYSADSDQQQGPWTDIYALGGVLYFAIGGSDPVDSTRRGAALFNGGRDPLISARLLGEGRYSERFLAAVDWALGFRIAERPQTLDDWLPALLGDAPATIELRRPPEPPPNRTSERMGLPRTGEHLRPERGTQEPPSQAIQREDTMRRAARHSSTASRRAASRTMDRSVSRESVRVHTGMRRMAGRPTHTTRSMQVRADLESRPLSSWRAFDHWLLLVARRIRFRVRRVLRYPVVLLVLVAGVAAVAWYADEQKDARKRAQSEERQSASASTESTQSDTPASTAAADQNDAGSDAPDRATSETGVAADDGDTTGNAGTGEPADSESADDVADTAPVEKPADVSNDTDPVADAAADASARADAEATADTQAGAREDTAVAESDSTAERGADASGRTAPSSAPDTDPDGDTDRKVTEGDRAQSDAMVRDDKTGKTTQNSPDTRDEAPSTEPAKTRTADGPDSDAVVKQPTEDAPSAVAAPTRSQNSAERRAAERAAAARRAEAKQRRAAERRLAELDGQRQVGESLAAVRRHLGNGNLDDAKTALVAARSFGGDLEEIEALQQDIDKALEDDRQPLSDEDLDEVLSSFNALARAIESGNRQAMDEITVSSRQNALFSQLMKSFEKLDIDIVGVRVRSASKTISATLRIKDMERQNGAIATPSDSYRDRDIVSRRVGGRWSPIEW